MGKPGILTISRSESKEIDPCGVTFDVRIEGEKYLLGNAALEKSQVLRNLATTLKTLGAQDEDFQVKGVSSKTSGGVFGSNTKAVYQLAIELEDLKRIGEYLGAITSQGGTLACELVWKYKEAEVADELSVKAMVAAKKAADRMVQAIGYRVVGIKRCTDGMAQDTMVYAAQAKAPALFRSRSDAPPDLDIGTDYRATRTVTRWVNVDFLVAPETSGPGG